MEIDYQCQCYVEEEKVAAEGAAIELTAATPATMLSAAESGSGGEDECEVVHSARCTPTEQLALGPSDWDTLVHSSSRPLLATVALTRASGLSMLTGPS